MSQPTSPTAGGGGGAEVLFGQILQTMQANMMQMSQDSQQRFELLERGLQDQARALTASSEAQVRALEGHVKAVQCCGRQRCRETRGSERIP